MGSPTVLQLDRLTAPVAGGNPAGADLSADFSPASLYQKIKDARLKAMEQERNRDKGDESNPDWGPVLELAPEALAEKTKDLRLAAWLTEAAVREYGFAGLRDGLRVTREFVEKYWDQLHPLPDGDGMVT